MKSEETVSALTFFSVGYVTINKARDSRKIQALPVESASGTDGEVTHNPVEQILKGIDKEGNAYEVKGTATRDLECDWLPHEDNRATPPDVRRGELVGIYRLANTSQYFWRCMGFRNGLRALEHVVLAFGATPSVAGTGMDFSKCYTMTFSPWDGHITIQTTKANKEPYAYTFQINTKDGLIGMQDDVGNYLELNSKDSRLKMQNADKSFVQIQKQMIDLSAAQSIKFTVGGTVMELTPSAITTKTQTTTMESNQFSIKTSTGKVNAGKWDFIIG